MLRCFLRQFQTSLSLQSIAPLPKDANNIKKASLVLSQYRGIFHNYDKKQDINGETVKEAATETPLLSESEYIKPYNFDYESSIYHNDIVKALRTRFRLTHEDIRRILDNEVVTRTTKTPLLLSALEILYAEGVNKKSFIDYPWLLTIDKNRLKEKLAILHTMPIRDTNHFVAFLRLSVTRLRKLVNSLNRESNIVPYGNRIYYISERLQTDPYVVTKYLSRRLFTLEMPFDMFQQNLQHMISYNVSSENVLRDLWAFRYTPRSIQMRFERAKSANKDKIMPWMVRCSEPILQRSLKLSMDELAVLGDKKSVVEYVAERLQFQVHEAKAIMDKHPSVMRVRVTKIKEVLDYLLNEAGFNRCEIAQVPRILCHSLETTKKRLDELKSYGCRPSSLVIVCRSKREYQKFLNYWLSMQINPKKSSTPNETKSSSA